MIGLMNLAEPIVPAGDEDIPIFTVMHREKGYDPDRYGMEFVASMPKQGADSAGSSDPVAAAFFGSDPGGDDEVLDQPADVGGGVGELPGVEMHDVPMADQVPAPAPVLLAGNSEEHVDVEGVRLGPDSSARELRAGCQQLGLGLSGSKNVLYRRLVAHSKKRALEDFVQGVNNWGLACQAPRTFSTEDWWRTRRRELLRIPWHWSMQQNLMNSSQEENQYLSSLQMRRELNTNLLMFPSRNGVATARAAGRDVMPIDKKTRDMILKVGTQSLPLTSFMSM